MIYSIQTRRAVLSFFIILSLYLLSACGGGALKGPLNGTAWNLASIDNNPPIEKTSISLEFKDGKVGGSSGCNSYGGAYQTNGEKLTMDSIAMTLMACEDAGVMEQERIFLEYLQDAQTFELTDDQLLIFSSGGQSLRFSQIP